MKILIWRMLQESALPLGGQVKVDSCTEALPGIVRGTQAGGLLPPQEYTVCTLGPLAFLLVVSQGIKQGC